MELLGFNLVVAHLIGDYVLQNDWMAQNKNKSHFICLVHAVTYIIPFCFCGIGALPIFLIGVQHFLQDRTNFIMWFMNKSGKSDFTKDPFAPWSIFAVDNSFHLLWIAIVLN